MLLLSVLNIDELKALEYVNRHPKAKVEELADKYYNEAEKKKP